MFSFSYTFGFKCFTVIRDRRTISSPICARCEVRGSGEGKEIGKWTTVKYLAFQIGSQARLIPFQNGSLHQSDTDKKSILTTRPQKIRIPMYDVTSTHKMEK